MTSIYIKEQGAKVGHQGERLIISKDGQVVEQFPLNQVERVLLMGNVQLTSQAATVLVKAGIDVVKFSSFGKYEWRLVGGESKHARLRQMQVHGASNASFSLPLAKAFVDGKIHNQRVLLQRQRQRLSAAQREPGMSERLQLFERALAGMLQMQKGAQRADTVESVRGYEGKAGAYYFQALGALLEPDWQFSGRNYYPPTDPFNSLLSFSYSLIQKEVLAAVYQVGFDPYVGFFHEISYGRPSLALDLMEEWRPLIADAMALELVNRGTLRPDTFRRRQSAKRPVELGEDGVRLVFKAYSQRLQTKLFHPDVGPGGHTRVQHAIVLQAQRLARVILRRAPAYEPYKAK